MARLRRSTYSLMVALLPATATVIGVIVLAQLPSVSELLGVGLIVAAVAIHRERSDPASVASPEKSPVATKPSHQSPALAARSHGR